MELPPYLLPAPRNVVLRTWDRLKGFIVRAGRVIVPVVAVLAVLSTLGTDGTFGHEDEGDSVLAEIGRSITPVFEPMGITEENWPATVGIFTGIFAKEAVVGTLDALYGALGADPAAAGDAEEAEAFDLLGGIGAAFATIPENLAGLTGTFGDPMGLNVGDTSSVESAAVEQGVATGTFGAMAERFDGRIGAFAYLLFILLYIPCVAASAAVYRELTRGWALFVVGWTTSVAYYVSVVFYQAATITRHPDSAMAWIVGLTLVFAAVIAGLRQVGRTRRLVPAAAE
jgi:ferrous iron transport protein B